MAEIDADVVVVGAGLAGAATAAALAAQADTMVMQMLGTRGATGPSAASVLNSGADIPLQDLSGIARSGAGVSSSGGDLHMGASGGAIQPIV